MDRAHQVVLPIVLAACVAACGTRDETTADVRPEQVLYVYNWADYIAESTIRDFEARTGSSTVRSSATSATSIRS